MLSFCLSLLIKRLCLTQPISHFKMFNGVNVTLLTWICSGPPETFHLVARHVETFSHHVQWWCVLCRRVPPEAYTRVGTGRIHLSYPVYDGRGPGGVNITRYVHSLGWNERPITWTATFYTTQKLTRNRRHSVQYDTRIESRYSLFDMIFHRQL